MSATSGLNPQHEAQMMAAVDLIRRTGSKSFSLRFSDDEQPIVWMALAEYKGSDGTMHQVAAGLTPMDAVMKLCAELLDGGVCQHCHRTSGFTADFEPQHGAILVDHDGTEETVEVCWYQYDPELKTYRRSCE